MAPAKQPRKIALVGASGTVGTPTLTALLAEGIHTITIISRSDSTATFPSSPSVRVLRGSYTDKAFLASALAGQDVLVMQLGFEGIQLQIPLMESAAAAGVKTVFPVEFGSDPDPTTNLIRDLPLLAHKKTFRDTARRLGMKVVAVINNPWFDWSLARGYWGIDIKARKARLYDGGNAKWVTTTLRTTGRATAGLLSLPDSELFPDGGDERVAYLQSFRTSQREVLDSVQRVTGTTDADWTVDVVDSVEAEGHTEGLEGFEVMRHKFYLLHMREGWGADYGHKVGDTMKRLGAEETESMDEVVGRVVREVDSAK